MDNFPHFSIKTCSDPSLEPSHQDCSNEGSQHKSSFRNKKNYFFNHPHYPLLSGALHYVLPRILQNAVSPVCILSQNRAKSGNSMEVMLLPDK